MEDKESKGPFEGLSLEAQQEIPVIYPKLKKAGMTFLIPLKSAHHRTAAYSVQLFHRPISQSINYDQD